jgi:copper transport protein
MNSRWRWLVVIAVLLAFMLPSAAQAHPEILQTIPAADAQLSESPAEIRIFFNEGVEAAFSDLQLFNAQSEQVSTEAAALDPADPTQLFLPLPPLTPGIYTVVWQTVGADGHKVIGNYVFTLLGDPNATPEPTSETGEIPVLTPVAPPIVVETPSAANATPVLPSIFRALMLIGALALAGSWFTMLMVVQPALPADAEAAQQQSIARWRRFNLKAIILLIIAIIGFMLVQTSEFAGRFELASLQAFALRTRLGQAVTIRLVLTILLAVLLALTPIFDRIRLWAGIMLGAALLLSFSMSSHAAAQNSPVLPILVDWIHMLATMIWVGGLMLLAFMVPVLMGTLQTKERANSFAILIGRFSNLALISVGILTLTGIYSASLHLKSFGELFSTTYGQTLLVKVLIFGVLIAFGAFQRLRLVPLFSSWVQQLASSSVMSTWQKRFRYLLSGEVFFALALIVVVGFLTNTAPGISTNPTPSTPPATNAQGTPLPTNTPRPTRTPVPSQPFAETHSFDNLNVTLEVSPAILGKNDFVVRTTDTNGNPLEVQRVVIKLEMLEMDMGVNQFTLNYEGNGTYTAPDSWLSMVGEWHFTVTVRRADADDVDTTFEVPVGG